MVWILTIQRAGLMCRSIMRLMTIMKMAMRGSAHRVMSCSHSLGFGFSLVFMGEVVPLFGLGVGGVLCERVVWCLGRKGTPAIPWCW